MSEEDFKWWRRQTPAGWSVKDFIECQAKLDYATDYPDVPEGWNPDDFDDYRLRQEVLRDEVAAWEYAGGRVPEGRDAT